METAIEKTCKSEQPSGQRDLERANGQIEVRNRQIE